MADDAVFFVGAAPAWNARHTDIRVVWCGVAQAIEIRWAGSRGTSTGYTDIGDAYIIGIDFVDAFLAGRTRGQRPIDVTAALNALQVRVGDERAREFFVQYCAATSQSRRLTRTVVVTNADRSYHTQPIAFENIGARAIAAQALRTVASIARQALLEQGSRTETREVFRVTRANSWVAGFGAKVCSAEAACGKAGHWGARLGRAALRLGEVGIARPYLCVERVIVVMAGHEIRCDTGADSADET
jgi:hypothetical protein